jgi:hypothetical protein
MAGHLPSSFQGCIDRGRYVETLIDACRYEIHATRDCPHGGLLHSAWARAVVGRRGGASGDGSPRARPPGSVADRELARGDRRGLRVRHDAVGWCLPANRQSSLEGAVRCGSRGTSNSAGGGSTTDFGRSRSRLWPKHLHHDRRPHVDPIADRARGAHRPRHLGSATVNRARMGARMRGASSRSGSLAARLMLTTQPARHARGAGPVSSIPLCAPMRRGPPRAVLPLTPATSRPAGQGRATHVTRSTPRDRERGR